MIELAATLLLIALGCTLIWTDVQSFTLPNLYTGALVATGIGFSAVGWPERLLENALGAAIGFAVFFAISRLYKRLRGREGLGGGDAKLAAGIGAWVGWTGLPLAIFTGSVAAVAVTAALALVRRERLSSTTRIPLGAYLVIGLWFSWAVQRLPLH